MKELKCPKCGSVFTVDESDYAAILQQVKTTEFNAELNVRLEELRKSEEQQRQLELQKQANESGAALQQKEKEIAELKAQLQGKDQEREVAILQQVQKDSDALQKKETELAEMKRQLQGKDDEKKVALLEKDLEMREALSKKDSEFAKVREGLSAELKAEHEKVDFYKDMKTRMSTKMIGETLEVHCSTQFNQMMRPMLPNAYFEKDNDVVEGTKGDFVFRDFGKDGTEYVSIMFEMKNEADLTANKHKNEDFFKKLDSDRRKKNCEFAVLVSLLEPDSELYNGGIVDVSHRYEKMYVIRPQFFLPLISLLVQTSRKSLAYKQALAEAQQKSVDVLNFENRLHEFQEGFGKNFENAAKKFEQAIVEIDKSIAALQKTKDALLGSKNQLRLANDKASGLTIRKLTNDSPLLRQQFADARKQQTTDTTAVA